MRFITKVDFNKNIEASDQFCKFGFDPVPEIIEEHLKLSGWVIGIETPAVGIELIQDGHLVGEALLTIHRPRAAKIYATFPGAEHSGFIVDIPLENINCELGKISIQAVFEDFKRIPLADLNLSLSSFDSPKKKTFFIHIPKTAGSSFNKFLHTYLQGNSHCESYIDSSQSWTFKDLDFLKSRDFISGHLNIQYFNQNFERDNYLLVTLLRNPVDQLISHVNWLAYMHHSDHNSKFYKSHPSVIKEMGYDLCERDLTNDQELVDFLLKYPGLYQNNQSRFVTKNDQFERDVIIEDLLNFNLVGLTENYSDFLEKYITLIGLEHIIEPRVEKVNVNSNSALNKKDILSNQKFVDFINDYNAVDLEVYNYFYNLQNNGLDNLTSEPLSRSEKTLDLRKQLKLQTDLDKDAENLEQLQIKFEQQSETLKFLQVELEKMQQDWVKTCSELQETKEELQRSQSQFDEVLAELEQTHLQLHQTEAELKQSPKIQQDWVKTCSELQETKEELQQAQSQFDEVLLELEITHSQLQQTQAELKQSPSQLQQTQTEFPKTQSDDLEPVSNRPKCQLSICAILKDEGLYIIEWLEFHKIVGVERFYLYDNNSTDDVFEKVKPYIDRGEIIWHDWPEQAGQRSSYNHCLKHYREESEWIAFIDLDEFLFPSEADDLKKVLEEYKEYPGIGVNWLCFGSSGHISKPEGLVTENFTRRPTDDGPSAQHGGRMKSIVRPTQTIISATPHHFIYVDDEQAVTENQQAFVGPRTPYTSVKKLRINHYLTKSQEEFRIKSQRGAGNGTNKPFAIFEKYDQNQIEDLTIQRFLPALKAAVESADSTFCYHQSMKLPDQFNPALYIASNAKLIESIGYNLEAGKKHYLEEGYVKNWPIDWFDPRSYLRKYKKLAKALGNDLERATRHYIVNGYKEQKFWTTDLSVIEAVLKREPEHKGAIQEKILVTAQTKLAQIIDAIQPVSNRPKCQLSICAILKDEGLYIIEWLEFHKIVGVERFYLYDNNSTDNVFEQVKPYIDRGEIVWHEWPEEGGQKSSYNHCLQNYKEESEWIAFIDLDEFLFPSEADDLKKVLEEYKEYPGIGVNWLCFGSSGHITKPQGLVIENFTRRPAEDDPIGQHDGRMKSIVRPTQTIKAGTAHHFIYVDNQEAVAENQQVFGGHRTPYTSVKKLRINHYLTKSREEFWIKSQRGAGNGTKKQFAIFEKYDQNQIEDLTIQRFLPALKAAVELASQTLAEPPIKSPEHQGTIQEKTLAVSLTTVTQIVEDNRPLAAIVCGYERGGTTLVNHILKQHPQLDSGFECGFLLKDNIADFLRCEPYHKRIRASWGLVESEVKYICSAKNWPQAYQRLLEKSRLIQNKDVFLFDKTPKYMENLSDILKKVPHIPCIVIVRDPRALISSWIKRQISRKNPHLLKKSCERYVCYGRGWKSAIENGYGDRILLVQYEDLCSNPYKEAEKMFSFLGFEFDPSYLNFDPSQKKFDNVYDTKISDQYLTEYQQYLDEKMCKFILQQTAEFKAWHWHPETTAYSTITPDIPPQNDF